ncbi:unnamed protein product [Prunus armeniaca]
MAGRVTPMPEDGREARRPRGYSNPVRTIPSNEIEFHHPQPWRHRCVVPHGGVILFDETANLKPDFVQTCYNLLSQEYGNIPIVLCSNKADVNHAMMMGNKNICWKMENNISLPYFEISANNDHNLEAPFLYLAKKLTENDKQQPPVLISPHIQMDMTAAQHGPESDPAAAQPFPVEDNNGCCSACLKPLVACLKACYYLVSIAVAFMNCVEEA